MKKALKITKKILNVVCWMMIIVVVLLTAITLISRINGTAPSIFGYSLYRVSSGSMEPKLMTGDVILDKEADDPESLEAGDIITFEGTGSLEGVLVTHEVYKAPYEENGVVMLQTKGVANDYADEPIELDRVRAVFVCRLAFLNGAYELFLSPWGLLIIIALVVFIFFDEIIMLVRILSGHEKTAGDAENINDIIERVKSDGESGSVQK